MPGVIRVEITLTYDDGTQRLLDRGFAQPVPNLGSICLSTSDADGIRSQPNAGQKAWLHRPRQAPSRNATIADDVLLVHDDECMWY